MLKSSEVDGEGTSTASTPTGSAEVSPEVVPIEEGGGTVPEGLT